MTNAGCEAWRLQGALGRQGIGSCKIGKFDDRQQSEVGLAKLGSIDSATPAPELSKADLEGRRSFSAKPMFGCRTQPRAGVPDGTTLCRPVPTAELTMDVLGELPVLLDSRWSTGLQAEPELLVLACAKEGPPTHLQSQHLTSQCGPRFCLAGSLSVSKSQPAGTDSRGQGPWTSWARNLPANLTSSK